MLQSPCKKTSVYFQRLSAHFTFSNLWINKWVKKILQSESLRLIFLPVLWRCLWLSPFLLPSWIPQPFRCQISPAYSTLPWKILLCHTGIVAILEVCWSLYHLLWQPKLQKEIIHVKRLSNKRPRKSTKMSFIQHENRAFKKRQATARHINQSR